MQCRFALVLCAAAGLADGTAALSGLPPGNYVLRTWNSSMSQEQAGALRVGTEALAPRRLQADVPAVEAMH